MNAERLSQFMAKIAGQTYPEPTSYLHTEITQKVLDELFPMLPHRAEVLDVGCGQGVALRLFIRGGFWAQGIALNDEDIKACQMAGYNVRKMDQNDLRFDAERFDCVYARHVLEHSIAPLWTLTEFHRVLKPNGLLYLEMPAPDTDCHHASNKNHYSIFGLDSWLHLIAKAGFSTESSFEHRLTLPIGKDTYYSFFCRKV